MRRRGAARVTGNPVLVGAVTTLIVATAVFLAYNANQGLPFVPTFQLKVEVPDAARLVVGNEVREGGERIGQVAEILPVRRSDGTSGAELELQLDPSATPIPADSTVIVRPRSALGLKYVDLVRGRSPRELEDGSVVTAGPSAVPPELDDVFNMFDPPTRENIRTNLTTFGGGFAGRGLDLNRTFAALPDLFEGLVPVMGALADPATGLRRFVTELADAARITAPVAGDMVRGFRAGADVFEAFSRNPAALREAIAESPATLRVGTESLRLQRPFLRRLAAISDEVSGTAGELRRSAPPLSSALLAGTRVLPSTPPLNRRLGGTFDALRVLASAPTTNMALRGLTATADTLTPTLRYLGPHITVCNYWTYFWTLISDHLSEEDSTGTLQRIQVKTSPEQENTINSFGATQPANGGADPATTALLGDPVHLHAQQYARAIDEHGAADCESGQRGYPQRLAAGAPEGLNIAVDPRTPGNQGPTFKGRPRVPEGQTFSAEPAGRGPKVAGP